MRFFMGSSLIGGSHSLNLLLVQNWQAGQGERKGFWSVWVNGNWRVTFRFVGKDAEAVDYEDYH